jgi:sugar O-acyltransferase (sialic acid O-acetyltransferase NeuD family)
VRERIVIWGAGGHARVVATIARQTGTYEVAGFLDDISPARHGQTFCGACVLGGADQLDSLAADGVPAVALAFGDSPARLRCAEVVRARGLRLVTLVHPIAVVAPDVRVGEGTIINAGVIIDPAVTIGSCAIIGAAATIAHDCMLADGVRVSSGTNLGGGVTLGRCVMIGTGSVVRSHVRIGAGTVVGAGAVVVDDLPEGVVAFGVPARVVRRVTSSDV